ncbi:hypothetical protein [Leptolyngbya sp. 7M]|uniref:Uncharacterized protein n=1 Tax=Leptolyngbya sp. NK1-12 TaxID=2547451 RepID=A0AA96WBZ0_9CYAN|nr:hypothetical protein [Leptolyngbya sp. 7M]MBF2045838.1 hypothetical protein [Elainella sp. C42_A2020_010]QYO64385.1 hypothetical protein JVX88_32635 [Leptolyngbya sp. 7M]RNJ68181.1 MAG: hypothetical protein EDM05_17225 [Leptolyngbya sp. IPPAS B-1204]WNZ22294.1 hypothetical protein HJG54_05060 [Leptolyngbya sp. NK1-12]
MITLSSEEIDQYRSQLADNEVALRALNMIEDCEGDLEDAAIALALQVGQEPDRTEQWLDGVAKRWRVFLCQTGIKEAIQAGTVSSAINLLAQETNIPTVLATPVVLYVAKTGIDDFCKPLQEKL